MLTAGAGRAGFLAVLIGSCLAACAFSTQIPQSKPSGLEQLLVVRSLERAVTQLGLQRYAGERIHLDVYTMTDQEEFAREYIKTRLERQGARVVPDEEEAGLRLRVFASVMGIDHAESLLGLPAITPPVIGVTIPEVPLYKSMRNRGYTDLKIYAFDGQTGEFLAEKSPHGIGEAKYNRYTVLILIRFTLTDVDKTVQDVGKK